uniref:Carboxylic ester hydrolase n=1 Tax=Parastrongyloides trichosuri TaxID=131310 RepID=A0A0N4ZAC4_PARTI
MRKVTKILYDIYFQVVTIEKEKKIIDKFLGIPYALPPVDSLRFKPPSMHPKKFEETEPLEAFKFKYSCMQNNEEPFIEINEDCLYLNIYRPANRKDVPVLVYFHGGDFQTGSSNYHKLDGSKIVFNGGIIVVTVNYRLNIFGFAFLGHDSEIKGNMGLQDQQMALEWIKINIREFGGDPNKVTIFGQSAGAASVTGHLYAPSSYPLFNRVIAHSGTIVNIWATNSPDIVQNAMKKLIVDVGCDVDNEVKCLQQINGNKLLSHIHKLIHPDSKLPLFRPIDNDKVFFKGSVEQKYKQRKFKKGVDLIMLKVENESTLFMPKILKGTPYYCNVSNNPDKNIPYECELERRALTNAIFKYIDMQDMEPSYFKLLFDHYNKPGDGDYRNKVGRFLSDALFNCKMYEFVMNYSENSEKKNIYFLNFNKTSIHDKKPKWMGVTHSDEIPFFFGFRKKNDETKSDFLKEKRNERLYSKKLMEMYSDFVKDGEIKKIPSFDNISKGLVKIDDQFPSISKNVIYTKEFEKFDLESCKLILDYTMNN